jgi:hypothetical protein
MAIVFGEGNALGARPDLRLAVLLAALTTPGATPRQPGDMSPGTEEGEQKRVELVGALEAGEVKPRCGGHETRALDRRFFAVPGFEGR